MIPLQVLGLVVACGLAAVYAVITRELARRRAQAARGTLAAHRAAVRGRLYDQDEHPKEAA